MAGEPTHEERDASARADAKALDEGRPARLMLPHERERFLAQRAAIDMTRAEINVTVLQLGDLFRRTALEEAAQLLEFQAQQRDTKGVMEGVAGACAEQRVANAMLEAASFIRALLPPRFDRGSVESLAAPPGVLEEDLDHSLKAANAEAAAWQITDQVLRDRAAEGTETMSVTLAFKFARAVALRALVAARAWDEKYGAKRPAPRRETDR